MENPNSLCVFYWKHADFGRNFWHLGINAATYRVARYSFESETKAMKALTRMQEEWQKVQSGN